MRLVLAAVAVGGCSFSSGFTGPIEDAPFEAITMCAPNQPLCAGRVREVCNSTGTGVDNALAEVCPLACVGDGQCVAASNIPDDTQRACLASSPVLMPPNNATVSFRPGGGSAGVDVRCTPSCGGGVSSISASRVAQANGSPIAMFCLHTVVIPPSVTVTVDPAVTSALALFVAGNVQISGKIVVSGAGATLMAGGPSGPAGGDGGGPAADDSSGSPGEPPCGGSGGMTVGTNQSAAGGGGGGGGHAGRGGDGGQGRADTNLGAGGAGGSVCGLAELTPLLGGGGGGAGGDGSCHPTVCGWGGGGGGGAIQIAATGSLVLSNNSAIRATGGAGFGSTAGEAGQGGGGGGGAGGGILLEAPSITVDGILDVAGGSGGVSNAGSGGAGGVAMLAGAPGTNQTGMRQGGAGGGGASGRIRINSAVGAACGAQAQPQVACTTSTLREVP